jgi:hypothetical protein
MEEKIFNLIIVDECDGIRSIRKQALEGLNNTISTIKKMQKEQPDIGRRITLLTFDHDHKTFRTEFRGVNDLKFYLYRVKQLYA